MVASKGQNVLAFSRIPVIRLSVKELGCSSWLHNKTCQTGGPQDWCL